ncbi:hypothetical protein SH584_03700 [Sphingomonas sp. LY29]|uniref:hypothetical protein n=1 Tax=Sphingomonas sp. LY29 TaxID=3095341 RepID=UPI002D791E83|nr:hypothetical protein [Sphingomonas sp. LY29]WRP26549.1 hypothetical protein SH584_03700 [Sphingomonas sp. LY29]
MATDPMTGKHNHGASWTDEATRELADLFASGRTVPEIAKQLGRTQEAIRSIGLRRGLIKPRPRRSDPAS